jgi:hypothetical protein
MVREKTISVKLPHEQLLALVAGAIISRGDCNVDQALEIAQNLIASARRYSKFLDKIAPLC